MVVFYVLFIIYNAFINHRFPLSNSSFQKMAHISREEEMARRQQNQQQQNHHEVQGTIGVAYGNLEMGQPIIIEVN